MAASDGVRTLAQHSDKLDCGGGGGGGGDDEVAIIYAHRKKTGG